MNKIPMPTQPYPKGDYSKKIQYFKECRGHIHFMEMRIDDMPRVDIWEMRMDYTGLETVNKALLMWKILNSKEECELFFLTKYTDKNGQWISNWRQSTVWPGLRWLEVHYKKILGGVLEMVQKYQFGLNMGRRHSNRK